MRRAIEKVDLETSVKVLESYLDINLVSSSTPAAPSSSKKRGYFSSATVSSSTVTSATISQQIKRSRRVENFCSLDYESMSSSSSSLLSCTSPSSSTKSFNLNIEVGLSLDDWEGEDFFNRTYSSPKGADHAKCESVRCKKIRSLSVTQEPIAEEGILSNLLKLQIATSSTTSLSDDEEDFEPFLI